MNHRCPRCHSDKTRSHGYYKRSSDCKTIARRYCSNCDRSFSSATTSSCFRQHKRRINYRLAELLSSGVSQRRSAILLRVNRKTIKRKLEFLGIQARVQHFNFLKELNQEDLSHLQFDDLITIEHTKLKPLSLSVIVTKKRKIIGATLSEIPAFGKRAAFSRLKYGRRKNEHYQKLRELWQTLAPMLPTEGRVDSDRHKNYAPIIKSLLPNWEHRCYEGLRGTAAGQGELKPNARDPLFSINHTLAMFRANINRLFRRTWNTTKDPAALMNHFWIYASFHNSRLLKS